MNIKHFLTLIVACVMTSPFCHADDIQALNAQAEAEYLIPIRPGTADGKVPFWNEFAWKYIYAPTFDFKTVKGAKSYRFTVTTKDSSSVTFTAETPTAALSPIWNQIPIGKESKLTVEALDKKGNVIKVVGEKTFTRDYPFHGPYREKVYSYDEFIRRALSFVHHMPPVKHWQDHDTPDMTYNMNSYLDKIIGNTIRNEVLYAEYFPEERDVCLQRCRNIAKFIMSQAEPADAVLAYFPPTYYGDHIAAGFAKNKGKIMVMDPTEVIDAFIDLYKFCGDRQYLDFALHIVDTYKKIRRPDGSYPVKVETKTGIPVNNESVNNFFLIWNLYRLENELNIYDYKDFRLSLEDWMFSALVDSFNWNSQFEDIPLEEYKPYQNPSVCIAAPVAFYMMLKDNLTKEELKTAEEIMRFCEDQFVMWDSEHINGIPETNTPCAFEQIEWDEPTDACTAWYLLGCTYMYKHTGDKLWLAKAKACAANITFMQNKVSGMSPTVGWRTSEHCIGQASQFWLNDTFGTVWLIRRFCELTGEK
ncbi:MAG: hypothetical protein KBT10_09415 [Bacteroidales bacterium]|nr:hypothetical protein [Candidatus Sodaliphilus aphodohippi]